MSVHTRSQKFAQAAYTLVNVRQDDPTINFDNYTTFAKKFPALIHTCGLAQAVAFALAKKEMQPQYIDDLTAVLGITGQQTLANLSRDNSVSEYMLLSRNAIAAASWLKRYVEAVAPDPEEE